MIPRLAKYWLFFFFGFGLFHDVLHKIFYTHDTAAEMGRFTFELPIGSDDGDGFGPFAVFYEIQDVVIGGEAVVGVDELDIPPVASGIRTFGEVFAIEDEDDLEVEFFDM